MTSEPSDETTRARFCITTSRTTGWVVVRICTRPWIPDDTATDGSASR